MRTYFERLLESIELSVRGLDEKEFERLVDASVNVLEKGHRIIVSGLGKNVPICDKFVGTMLSFGLNAAFLHTNTAVHGDLGAIRDGDLVIILTKSGETAESLYLLDYLLLKNITIWSITFNEDSTMAKRTENSLILSLDHEGDKWNIVPNNSTTLYLIILQALAICISEKMDISLEEFRKNHPGGYIGECLNDQK